jgi:hypothetical protein
VKNKALSALEGGEARSAETCRVTVEQSPCSGLSLVKMLASFGAVFALVLWTGRLKDHLLGYPAAGRAAHDCSNISSGGTGAGFIWNTALKVVAPNRIGAERAHELPVRVAIIRGHTRRQ